ncbi:MAG: class I SAM-dependent methyltransferase [Actinobacteria bacterium]|nr:class I SAM-dependent methyltransferase [Actinomycetota bacterium]MBU1942235.1 class I SAM-dependent methyltransferase [Actinomycetota bacterium]MBU2687416.1 class I SAM-dependent methyltransferase [Actinomycetota bacterium]
MERELYREMYEQEKAHWWFRAKRAILLDIIERYRPARARPRFLDLGSGTGAMMEDLAPLGETVGMDFSADAVEYATGRGAGTVLQGGIPEDVGRLEGRFDVVLMSDLLEHLDDDRAALEGTIPLIADGGILVVTVPAYQWLYAPRDAYHHHRRRYSRRGLKRLLIQAGYQIELLSYYNTILFPPAAAARILSKIRRAEPGPDLSVPPGPLNRLAERVFASERHLLGRVPLPFGLSLIAVARPLGFGPGLPPRREKAD